MPSSRTKNTGSTPWIQSSPSLLVANIIDNGPVTRQQLIVIGVCFLLNMLDGFDITAMAVTANTIGLQLNLGTDKLGIVFSFALAGMMLGAMLLGSISDVIGRRNSILVSVTVAGTAVLLTSQVETLWQLMLLRFISGLGAGAMLASQATLAAEFSPTRYRALSVASVTAGYPLGAMVTGLLAGHIMPGYGWQGMFLAGGLATLVMAIIAALSLPESLQFLFDKRPGNALPRINRVLDRLKRPRLESLPTADTTPQDATHNLLHKMLTLFTPQHRTQTLTLWVAFFFSFAALYFLMSWIPKLVMALGFSAQHGNEAFSLFNLGGVLGVFLMGGLTTRWPLNIIVSLFLLLAALTMMVFVWVPASKTLLFSVIFIIGILQQGGFVGLYAVATQIYPSAIRNTGVGWSIGVGRGGAVIGPAVAGFMLAGGVSVAGNFLVFSVPLLIAGAIALRLRTQNARAQNTPGKAQCN